MISRIRSMKINIFLILGIVIILVLFFICIYGYQLIPFDPYATNFGVPKIIDGNLMIYNPPHSPNEMNLWGTDVIGRDILSRVIYGAKLSIQLSLVISLLRLLIALPFGIVAGFGNKLGSKVIDVFNTVFSAIPALIFCYIILGLDFIQLMEIEFAFIVYILVLTFVGWGRFGTIIRDRVRTILSEDFIKGERAIGKSTILIVIQNVLPHLFATIIIYYFIEVSRVLIIMAELGVLGVYIGVNKVSPLLIKQLGIDIMPSYYPEWGSMLSSSRYAISAWKPWIVIYPALALFVSVLGFNLLGEGLKIELSKRNSKFILLLKRIPYHLSPKTYFYQLRNFSKYKTDIVFKTIILLGMTIYIIIPGPNSKINIDNDHLFSHLEELSKTKYSRRDLGSEGNYKTAEYIMSQLKEADIDPLFGDEYISKSSVELNKTNIKESKLYVKTEDGNKNYELNKDYILEWLFLDKISNDTYGAKLTRKLISFKNYANGNYDENEKYFVIIDKLRNVYQITDTMNKKNVHGVMVGLKLRKTDIDNDIPVAGTLQDLESSVGKVSAIQINVSGNVVNELLYYEGHDIVLDTTIEYIKQHKVNNIGGIIKGKDSTKPPIIIACNYDYKEEGNGSEDKGLLYSGSSVAVNLEIARTLKSNNYTPERDIYFMFFDGSLSPKRKGIDEFIDSKFYSSINENHFVMYLNYLGYKDSNTLYMDNSYLYPNIGAHFDFTKLITKRGEELDMKIVSDKVSVPSDGIVSFSLNGSSGISIGSVQYTDYIQENSLISYNSRNKVDTLVQNLDLIDRYKLTKQAQLIIDSLTMYDYELK